MNLNLTYVKSVLNIYDEMINSGISLVYIGEFNQEITKTFTSMTEGTMDRDGKERKVKKKVYHVLVETLQNMNKHSDETDKNTGNERSGQGLFMLGQQGTKYFVITANKVQKIKRDGITSAIEEVNNSTPEQLKEMYKQQMKGGNLSDRGGAGLGLIDIARKTGKQLDYQFLDLDEKNLYFILKVEVSAD
ncbi:SiaB family protein kinase [Cyclobacteriaceae bacterium]|nr:SiaB family protein kinase [Cyclobacteriaceae bacterium]